MPDLTVTDIVAIASLVLATASFIWGRWDKEKAETSKAIADARLAELEAADRAILQFGHVWGDLVPVDVEHGPWKTGLLVAVENVGRRPGGISSASWSIVNRRGSLVQEPKTAFITPRDEWTGQGNTTIPAGTRRLFVVPLPPRALLVLESEDEELHFYLRAVGAKDLIRAGINSDGIRPLPWTAEEEHFAELEEQRLSDLAESYGKSPRHGSWT